VTQISQDSMIYIVGFESDKEDDAHTKGVDLNNVTHICSNKIGTKGHFTYDLRPKILLVEA
jgi:hypothetical protein